MTEKESKPILDKNTLIPIGVVLAIVLACLGVHSWLTTQFQDLKDMVRDINERVARMEEKYDSDKWTGTDMALWVAELRRLNPTMTIPDPVHRKIR